MNKNLIEGLKKLKRNLLIKGLINNQLNTIKISREFTNFIYSNGYNLNENKQNKLYIEFRDKLLKNYNDIHCYVNNNNNFKKILLTKEKECI